MDAGFLNYHKEEEFSSLFLDSGDISGTYEDNHLYTWEWEHERELNGDIGIIPSASVDFCPISTSPPTNSDDFHRIVSDWQNAVKLDHDTDDLTVDVTIRTNDNDLDKFDLTEYVNDIDDRQRAKQEDVKVLKTGGKRIDIDAQRYLLDDEQSGSEDDAVDVETVSDSDQISPLVLQATDVNTLLEQFEANENTNSELTQKRIEIKDVKNAIVNNSIKDEPLDPDYEFDTPEYPPEGPNCNKFHTTKELPNFVEETGYLKPTPIDDIITNKKPSIIDSKPLVDNTTSVPITTDTSKQILNSLPIELIDRIRQNSKRRPITLIPPIIPTKKRNQNVTTPTTTPNIQLDHSYCSNIDVKPIVTTRKDSGFSSAEEDERSAILRHQPKVKNADGTLMVSLLKANTIINAQSDVKDPIQKRKLNLEEYKKRLQTRSGQNSPLLDEDENTRRLRHQEMLMKMAYDVIVNGQSVVTVKVEEEVEEVKPPPLNVVKRTLVSAGTNTEESWGHVEQILERTKVLPPNSLISSIVEQLPLIKVERTSPNIEHGEDKTILYIDANTPKPSTQNASTQTIRSTIRSRDRNETPTNTSSSLRTSNNINISMSCDRKDRYRPLDRPKAGSRSYRSSSSSSSSTSSSRSCSRSRSPSPQQRRRNGVELERVVEERRVIYVGRIEDGMSREELRRRFARFGQISGVSTHFRTEADNYGFVTFLNKEDAYRAVEHGNDDPADRRYDLSFGGRRLFCQQKYSDLDRVADDNMDTYFVWGDCQPSMSMSMSTGQYQDDSVAIDDDVDSFDALLRAAQAKLLRKQTKQL